MLAEEIKTTGDLKRIDPKAYNKAKKIGLERVAQSIGIRKSVDPLGNKEKLLALARTGAKMPKASTPLGRAVRIYLKSNGSSYDPDFEKLIAALVPSWLIKQKNSPKTKIILLELANSGEVRPDYRTSLGRSLASYTRPKNKSYDEVFTLKLRALVPVWFISPKERVVEMKDVLITLAKNGSPKPHYSSLEGKRLRSYTEKIECSYDSVLSQYLRTLRPDWFEDNRLLFNLHKLLKLNSRPNKRSKDPEEAALGESIHSIRRANPDYYQQLVTAKPNWNWRD